MIAAIALLSVTLLCLTYAAFLVFCGWGLYRLFGGH